MATGFSLFTGSHLAAQEAALVAAVTALKPFVANTPAVAAAANMRYGDLQDLLARNKWSFAEVNRIATAVGKTVTITIS